MKKKDLYSIYNILCSLKEGVDLETEVDPILFERVQNYINSFSYKPDIVYYAASLLIFEEIENKSIYKISEKKLRSRLNNKMKFLPSTRLIPMIESIQEDAPANAVGSGNVAGTGENPPGKLPKKKKYVRKFAGRDVFLVDPNRYQRAKMGKKRLESYSSYIGDDELGQSIIEWAEEFPKKPIILMNSFDGDMMFIRYGKTDKQGLI
jgi:hypothetical protein